MQPDARLVNKLLDMVVEHIDIPKSYYQKAADRHTSLGEWLCRPDSKVAAYRPDVAVQGSFRYGTVNRPLLEDEEYDLDDVTTLSLPKAAMSQKALKQLYGTEIKLYAKAHGMLAPVEEKDRCWRLVYADDDLNFHLDTLPCVPEEQDIIRAMIARGAPAHLAALAVAITDRRLPNYELITGMLLSSNPRGFAAWFEECCRPSAQGRMRQLVEGRVYASVDAVPPYEWKTPLQRGIQILKRHRDVMFRNNRDVAPISMILTNLAAHAYEGESDLWSALKGIVERIPRFVSETRSRVPNPADPVEDYADKWSKKPELEDHFWAWHMQVKADVAKLPSILAGRRLEVEVSSIFGVDLTQTELRGLAPIPSVKPTLIRTAPVVAIGNAPRPWGRHG
jgi:hypothetical protein